MVRLSRAGQRVPPLCYIQVLRPNFIFSLCFSSIACTNNSAAVSMKDNMRKICGKCDLNSDLNV